MEFNKEFHKLKRKREGVLEEKSWEDPKEDKEEEEAYIDFQKAWEASKKNLYEKSGLLYKVLEKNDMLPKYMTIGEEEEIIKKAKGERLKDLQNALNKKRERAEKKEEEDEENEEELKKLEEKIKRLNKELIYGGKEPKEEEKKIKKLDIPFFIGERRSNIAAGGLPGPGRTPSVSSSESEEEEVEEESKEEEDEEEEESSSSDSFLN